MAALPITGAERRAREQLQAWAEGMAAQVRLRAGFVPRDWMDKLHAGKAEVLYWRPPQLRGG